MNYLKFTSLLALAAAFTPFAHSQGLANDPFAIGASPASGQYTSGAGLIGQDPTIAGFSGAWESGFGTAATVQPGSLSYSAPGYLAPTGGSVSITDGTRARRAFDGSNPFVSDGAVYISFLFQVNDASVYKAFELNSGGDDGTRAFQLGVANTGDFPSSSNFGMRVNNTGALSASLGAYDANVNLFVVKFSLSSAGGGDSVTAWMNPTIPGEGDPTGGVSITGFDLSPVSLLAFGSFGGAGAGTNFDEIRMGTTFQSVTAVPEPATVAMLSLGLGGALMIARRKRS